jgi:uncharacterized protein with PIN domain
MPAVTLRFYEELNDFLPRAARKQEIACTCAPGTTVKHLIEAQGVPHPEVELIIVDGESVDFSYPVRDGERISVYPTFEALDVTPALKLRPEPLRRTRFVADAHLGALARYLRMLGFDTLYENACRDAELARLSAREHRIVLTRDRALLMHRLISHGCYVRATRPMQQLEEIVLRLDLVRSIRPFSRCLRCNRALESVAGEAIGDRLPGRSPVAHFDYRMCRACNKVYWEGSHWRRMSQTVHELVARLETANRISPEH